MLVFNLLNLLTAKTDENELLSSDLYQETLRSEPGGFQIFCPHAENSIIVDEEKVEGYEVQKVPNLEDCQSWDANNSTTKTVSSLEELDDIKGPLV